MNGGKWWTRFGAGLGIAVSFGAALLVTSACEDNSNTRSAYCNGYCEKLELCNDETDLAGCVDACKSQAFRSTLYFEKRATCAEDMSCNHWAAQVTSDGEDDCATEPCELVDCIENQLEGEKPNSTQEELCEAVKNKLFSCDPALNQDELEDDCVLFVLGSSDDYAEESRKCVDEPCPQIERCLEKLADRNGTDARIFNGVLQ